MTRSDWDNDEIVARFRDWLTRTSQEISEVDDNGRGSAAVGGIWGGVRAPEPTVAGLPEVGLLQVIEALTAMRHELKLQTKSGRSLEESVQAARQGLDVAMRQFQSVQAREEECARRAALPLVEALAGLDESLARGAIALDITHRQLTEAAPQQLWQSLDELFRQLPWWRRWWRKRRHRRNQDHVTTEMARIASEEFARLSEGYRLIQSRMWQELEKAGLSRVATVGRRVDPTCMTVVEIADDSEGLSETVVEELRPGYLWRQTVIRFAEVRAVKSRGSAAPANEDERLWLSGDDIDAAV